MEWVHISENLPPFEVPVFLYGTNRSEGVLFGVGLLYSDFDTSDEEGVADEYWMYGNFEWTCMTYPSGSTIADKEEITHWMPLPRPPSEEASPSASCSQGPSQDSCCNASDQ